MNTGQSSTRGIGGSYAIDATGERTLLERTSEHEESIAPALGPLDALITGAAPAKSARKSKE